MIKTAKEVEAAMHRKDKEQKSAQEMIKIAKSADLELDEDMKFEIGEKLGKKLKNLDDIASVDIHKGKGVKRKEKELSKVQ